MPRVADISIMPLTLSHTFQGSRPKGKLSKATRDKMLRSGKSSKPPSGAAVGKAVAPSESDSVVENMDLKLHPVDSAWTVPATSNLSQFNGNNGTINSNSGIHHDFHSVL